MEPKLNKKSEPDPDPKKIKLSRILRVVYFYIIWIIAVLRGTVKHSLIFDDVYADEDKNSFFISLLF
jgi:hypothetical protein